MIFAIHACEEQKCPILIKQKIKQIRYSLLAGQLS